MRLSEGPGGCKWDLTPREVTVSASSDGDCAVFAMTKWRTPLLPLAARSASAEERRATPWREEESSLHRRGAIGSEN